MICSDLPHPEVRKTLQIGDVVKLSEINLASEYRPFGYRGAECRWFKETASDKDGSLYIYKGIACNTVKNDWEVIDKF